MNSGIISINNNVFEVLFALSAKEQEIGLMFLDPPIPNMAFVYSKPQINKFWMSNTKVPLDIVFASNNYISQIHKGEPYSTSVIGDNRESDLIIEFPFGTAQQLNIKIGSKIEILKPSFLYLKSFLNG